jgi:YVTN family beta-propeller protein
MTTRLKSASVLIAVCLLNATARGQPYVEDSIDVGGAWVGSMCYSTVADVVYGASEQPGIIFAISCSTNRVVSSIVVHGPLCVAYDPTENKAYCSAYNDVLDSVLVIDGATHTRLRAIPLDWATELVWDSTGDKLYVSRVEENLVSVIDCRTDSVVCHIAVGAGPLKMHLNTRHRKLYVQNYDEGSVSIIDLGTNRVVATLPVGSYPQSGCYSTAADKYYCGGGSQVTVVSGARDSVLSRIPLAPSTSTQAMTAVDPEGLVMASVYGASTDTIYVVDTRNDSIVGALRGGRNPRCLAYSPSSELVYSANGLSRSVTVVAGNGTGVVTTLDVGRGPFVLVPVAAHRLMYVGHLDCSEVYVIRDVAAVAEQWPGARFAERAVEVQPNPFTRATSILWSGADCAGAVSIHSSDGRLVARLESCTQAGMTGRAVWNGKDEEGRQVPPGVYVVEADGSRGLMAKLIKLK